MRFSSLLDTRKKSFDPPRTMKIPLLEVSVLVILLTLFKILDVSEALPIRDEILGGEADVWYDTVRRFYGPWSEVHKLNGEYADYNDYGARIQDFVPGPEDVPADQSEVAESGPADFQSNYGEFGSDDSGISFQPPSAEDQSAADDHDHEDQITGGDPDSEELAGNVHWTTE